MTTATATRTVTINLEAGCDYASCAELAWRFKRQLDVPKYAQGASILPMPASLDEWRMEHRTARKRADRAVRLGYRFAEVDNSQFSDDIHEINVSLPERQGRPMSDGYLTRRRHGPLPEYPCDRHRIHTYGVLQDDRLRAYLTLYVVADLKLVSMILGHAESLRDDVMYALFAEVVERHAGSGGFFYYNRHDSGTSGLVYYKERLGFHAGDIEWRL